MSAYTVSFIKENISARAQEGTSVLEVMHAAGIPIDAPCGGQGKCGKCRVRVRAANVKDSPFVEALACQTFVREDLAVETVPAGSGEQILTEGHSTAASGSSARPLVLSVPVIVPPCPLGKSISDWTRFADSAARELHIAPAQIIPDPETASRIGPYSRENVRRSGADSSVAPLWAVLATAQDPDTYTVVDLYKEKPAVYTAAFDIGTTTLVGYLLNEKNSEPVAVCSRLNPQTAYGADVISRAGYTLDHGTAQITGCIQSAIAQMLHELAGQAHISTEQICGVSIAGNTCMHHLFLGISVDSLVHSPYTPSVEEPMVLQAARYGLSGAVHPRAALYMLPNIAGFVGADTVACLVSARLAQEDDWTLLIDIGTNGEMVLGRRGRMAACSTAAGPAFEGAGISCGMRGSEGAISHVRWKEDHWEYDVIPSASGGAGKGTPVRGICGSGLLDAAAQLLLSGQMDEYGAKTARSSCKDKKDIMIAFPGSEVTLSVKDIRQVQLAKAAIATGVRLLAKKMGIRVDQIRKVWLAGAFGSFLSPDSACAIGLIPPELKGRIRSIGNASGTGARMVLQDRENWLYAARAAREADFLELAADRDFQDTFVDELLFPET